MQRGRAPSQPRGRAASRRGCGRERRPRRATCSPVADGAAQPRRTRRRARRSRRTCPSRRTPARAARCRPARGEREPRGATHRGPWPQCRVPSAPRRRGHPARVAPARRRSAPGRGRSGRRRAAAPATRRRRARRTSAPLARPPATHTTCSNDASDAAAACGFVALESSTQRRRRRPSATCGDPVRVGAEAAQARRGRRPAARRSARASAAAASAFATLCGASGRPTSATSSAQLGGGRRALRDERPVARARPSTTPSIRQPGHAEGEPDRPAALDDVGLPHQLLGHGVGDVVDAGDLGAGVDPALVRGVVRRASRASRGGRARR